MVMDGFRPPLDRAHCGLGGHIALSEVRDDLSHQQLNFRIEVCAILELTKAFDGTTALPFRHVALQVADVIDVVPLPSRRVLPRPDQPFADPAAQCVGTDARDLERFRP